MADKLTPKIIRHLDGNIYDVLREGPEIVVIRHPQDRGEMALNKDSVSPVPAFLWKREEDAFISGFQKNMKYRSGERVDFAIEDIANEALKASDLATLKAFITGTYFSVLSMLGE